MDKLYTAKITETNLSALSSKKTPKTSTIDFLKQYARIYSFANIGSGEINSFVTN